MSCVLAVGILGIAVIGATSTRCRPFGIGMGLVVPPWWRSTSIAFKVLGKHPRFRAGTVTTRLRRFATDAVGGSKFVDFFFMWIPYVSISIFGHGFVHRVKLYQVLIYTRIFWCGRNTHLWGHKKGLRMNCGIRWRLKNLDNARLLLAVGEAHNFEAL